MYKASSPVARFPSLTHFFFLSISLSFHHIMLQSFVTAAILLASRTIAYDQTLGFNSAATVEVRTIDEIHKAALAEGGVVTMWLGGDERTDEDALKNEFEKRFPGMTLNLTTDLSKYHSGRFDEQLAAGKVYVDSIAFQTVHDFPRWDNEGALLHYAPVGFEKVYSPMKDVRAAFYGVLTVGWAGKWNTDKLPGIKAPVEWEDWLRPEFKDKLVLTYPNDDDAVLYAFDLMYFFTAAIVLKEKRANKRTACSSTANPGSKSSSSKTPDGSAAHAPLIPSWRARTPRAPPRLHRTASSQPQASMSATQSRAPS